MKTFLSPIFIFLFAPQLLLADIALPRPHLPPKPITPTDPSLAPMIFLVVLICITGLAILYLVRKERRSGKN